MNIDGLVQDCSNSIANAMELQQSGTKPSIGQSRKLKLMCNFHSPIALTDVLILSSSLMFSRSNSNSASRSSNFFSACDFTPWRTNAYSFMHWTLNKMAAILFLPECVSSSDVADGIFQLIWSSPSCLLIPWLLKSAGHQQAWYKQVGMCKCIDAQLWIWSSSVEHSTKSKIWCEMWIQLNNP